MSCGRIVISLYLETSQKGYIMNNNNFVCLFKRLHPSLNVVVQKDRPSQLPVGYRYLELKTTEQGLAYFNKGIFRFQETPDGFKKLVFTKNINGQLLEEVILKVYLPSTRLKLSPARSKSYSRLWVVFTSTLLPATCIL